MLSLFFLSGPDCLSFQFLVPHSFEVLTISLLLKKALILTRQYRLSSPADGVESFVRQSRMNKSLL